jgi:polar amino acid transport system substrate-binding protein
VKVPADADLKQACYNTLGAIALQGIRQADLRLGESCVVIGLGLLGQLTCLMLRASGVRTAGVDISAFAVETARAHCCDTAWNRDAPGLSAQIASWTEGLGVDGVIIAAATPSHDPINLAGEIARKRGRVVVVGAVPTGFDREPHWYKKELELRMSCSYGPGRYDLAYEEKGQDYPSAYVRWTENRNMQAFQTLVYSRRVDVDYLTTHAFSLDDAPKAYDMIVNGAEPFLGVVLEYDVDSPPDDRSIVVKPARVAGQVKLAFIGAGSYAQSNLLPNLLKGNGDVALRGVMTNSGTTSKRVAERFGFEFCTSQSAEILNDTSINTVFIATRHDSHAGYVVEALEAGKHVFVEKPLCLTAEELDEIRGALGRHNDRHLMVGFNRRFAPLALELKQRLGSGPKAMLYRVNAGAIPAGTWVQDAEIGGGRIIGEACHFVDFLSWMCDALPSGVHAVAMQDPHGLRDTVSISISFLDGSVGTVCYYANGSKTLSKEYVEIYGGGLTGSLTDFAELRVFGDRKPYRKKLLSQDKGQANMVRAFVDAVKTGGCGLIEPATVFRVTEACFGILESIRTREAVRLGE